MELPSRIKKKKRNNNNKMTSTGSSYWFFFLSFKNSLPSASPSYFLLIKYKEKKQPCLLMLTNHQSRKLTFWCFPSGQQILDQQEDLIHKISHTFMNITVVKNVLDMSGAKESHINSNFIPTRFFVFFSPKQLFLVWHFYNHFHFFSRLMRPPSCCVLQWMKLNTVPANLIMHLVLN